MKTNNKQNCVEENKKDFSFVFDSEGERKFFQEINFNEFLYVTQWKKAKVLGFRSTMWNKSEDEKEEKCTFQSV